MTVSPDPTREIDLQHRWTRSAIVAFGIILLIAFALRFGLALALPNVYHPDEIFQSLEPAHRVSFGWGVITWEWRDGIRSWLFPGLLSGIMSLAAGPASSPNGYLVAIAAFMTLASLSIVWVAFLMGWRDSGLPGAVLCGGLAAIWCDVVYFGPKTLSEVPAAYLLIIAVYMAETIRRDACGTGQELSGARFVLLGLLLGLTFCLRFHLAPVLLLVAAWACGTDLRRRWRFLALGAALPFLLTGILDWTTWGTPFQSTWKNFWINVIESRSHLYGRAPFYWYIGKLVSVWGAAVTPMFVLFILGAGKAPLFAATAITVVLTHLPLAHKELRFIFPAIPPALVVVGLGSAALVARFARHLRPDLGTLRPALSLLGFWALTSIAVALGAGFRPNWALGANILHAQHAAWAREDLCGLGILDIPWGQTGGYSHFHRPIPMSWLWQVNASDATEASSGFNYLLIYTDGAVAERVAGFAPETCWEGVCLLRRDGPCTGSGTYEINSVLMRRGQ